MKALVGKDIRITDCTPKMYEHCKNKLTFANPEYYKLTALGKYTGKTPKELTLIQRDGVDIIVPFGMLPDFLSFRKYAFDDVIPCFGIIEKKFEYQASTTLYDYQEEAVKLALMRRQGVIVAPCGAGKTQIGLMIAQKLGMRTLWLTHTTDLLNQSLERAKSIFDLEDDDYGTITAGKVNIGKVFTFATVQTMSKIDLPLYERQWDCIIVDECHHVAGTPTRLMMFYKVISNLCARFKYGLTATPKRSDGLAGCMFALLGDKITEIPKEAVESKLCPICAVLKQTEYAPDIDTVTLPDGTLSYTALITDITENEARNRLIVDDILKADGGCLVLTDRVAHVRRLVEMIGDSAIGLSASTSKAAKAARKSAIEWLGSGKVKVLVATYQLAKEGLDIPTLRHLFMVTPQKNEVVVTQSAGRVARKADGKKFGTIHDYCDQFGMLKSWFRKRTNLYKKMNCTLTYLDP